MTQLLGVRTVILTAFAGGLFWLTGPPWLCILFGVETTGSVTRDGERVRFNDAWGRRHTVPMQYDLNGSNRLWGSPVRVQYLPFAPGVSWCPEEQDSGKLVVLLVLYIALVAAPLMLLWWRNMVHPALEAFREARVHRSSIP